MQQVAQGISADLIATLEGFSREDLDQFALESQQKAAAAQQAGHFSRSLVPVLDPESGAQLLAVDEFPRHDTSREGLAQLEPSFVRWGATPVDESGKTSDQIALEKYPQAGEIRHLHTPGNSSGIVDGAAAVAIASSDYAKGHGLKPRARVRAVATAGAEPLIMLTAPTPAAEKALGKPA